MARQKNSTSVRFGAKFYPLVPQRKGQGYRGNGCGLGVRRCVNLGQAIGGGLAVDKSLSPSRCLVNSWLKGDS